MRIEGFKVRCCTGYATTYVPNEDVRLTVATGAKHIFVKCAHCGKEEVVEI